MAKRKELPEEVDGFQSTQQRSSSDKKCFNCAKAQRECLGTYSFTEKCDPCKKTGQRCYPQDNGKMKFQPAEEKCHPCRKSHRNCDGTYPFTQACSTCQKRHSRCTAEPPEDGLPKDKRCQACVKNKQKCIGEPPFKNKCRCCKDRKLKCYPQGTEVPKPIPQQERCVGCKRYNWRGCDGKRPCTQCVTRGMMCSHKDSGVKWTYQPDPEKWKEPTFPTCNECTNWNKSHRGQTLSCDGKSPCNCCLDELSPMTPSLNCTYRYENGVSKYIRLHGERTQIKRKRTKAATDRRERLRRELEAQAPQNDTTAEDENLPDEDLLPNDTGDKEDSQIHKGSDSSQEESGSMLRPDKSSDRDGTKSDAGGESNNEHPNQDHGHDDDDDLRSRFFDHKTPKSYKNPNRKRATGRDPSPPNDQNEWGGFESSGLKDPPNQTQIPRSQRYGDGEGHRLVDGRGSKRRKVSRYRSIGESRESVGRR